MSKIFAFTDLETTGLEPDESYILEVGWVLTDEDLDVLLPGRSFLVDHGERRAEVYAAIESNPFILNMHTENGLYEALQAEDAALWSLDEIRDAYIQDIKTVVGPYDTVHLAGYSVDFDRRWLKYQPEWRNLFTSKDFGVQIHHRVLDLSSFGMMYETVGATIPTSENPNPHRSLEDSLDALQSARAYQADVRKVAF